MASTLVKKSASVPFGSGVTSVTPTLPSASVAGNLLVCPVYIWASAVTSLPTGWVRAVQQTSSIGYSEIWYYANNPGGISSVVVTFQNASNGAAMLLEYNNAAGTLALDQTGGAVSTVTTDTSLAVTTAANVVADNELVVTSVGQGFNGAATKITLSPGTGFTQEGNWGNAVKQNQHGAFDDRLDSGSSSGSTVSETFTTTVSGQQALHAAIATFYVPSAAPPALQPRPVVVITAVKRAAVR